MVRNNISIMAHYDAANKGEETISSSYKINVLQVNSFLVQDE
jgi:hypothetical protein